MKQRKSKSSLPSKYLLAIMTVFCIMLLFFSYATGFSGGPLNIVASYVFIPMQKGIDFIGNSISISSNDTKTREELIAENEALQAKIDELTNKLNTNMLKQTELETLQKLYELDQTYFEYETTGARIVAKDTSNWFDTFTIDKGSRDGIEVNMNVIADQGLVGIVTEVSETYSVVRSVIDDTSNVSATIVSTRDNCIISGSISSMTESSQILLSNLDDDDNVVAIGDAVVTSNISDKYLPGLLIGYVTTLSNDANDLTKSGTITPVVDFKHLSDVLIILQTKENYVNGD